MSHLLFRYFYDDDVDRFECLLGVQSGIPSASPNEYLRPRKPPVSAPSSLNAVAGLSKIEVNARDHMGLTILLRVASSTNPYAIRFVRALLAHPGLDLHVQDVENGWNALHRALYHGNASIALCLLQAERRRRTEFLVMPAPSKVASLIKTKDRDGSSPFELYNKTIKRRMEPECHCIYCDDDDSSISDHEASFYGDANVTARGDELFVWGSNKNFSLGVGEDSDRQYPDRILLCRPDHLTRKLAREEMDDDASPISQVPVLAHKRPLYLHDVVMAKYSTAVLTTDPVSNLYICGIGKGGRLGLGDETTQFRLVSVQGPLLDKHIIAIALADFHSMAVTSNGELWTWGSNTYSQLGYGLPRNQVKDDHPIITTPRQVFGVLKKEVVRGVAASAIHSVAHTSSALFCWGKNQGQLGIMDADSRSLDVQQTPRRVAPSLFSTGIAMVSAIEKATCVLLQNNSVCVFTQFGYKMVKFSYEGIFDRLLHWPKLSAQNHHVKFIASGGSTIVALTEAGDLFACEIRSTSLAATESTSTTNPSKIKNAISTPECIWLATKDGVNSVDVGENGSVIIATKSGACWRRISRQTPKSGYGSNVSMRRRDFKFERVPLLADISVVRASTFGAFAAIRNDCDIMKKKLEIPSYSRELATSELCSLRKFKARHAPDVFQQLLSEFNGMGMAAMGKLSDQVRDLACQMITSTNLAEDIVEHMQQTAVEHDSDPMLNVIMCTSASPEARIPVHGFIAAARSPTLRLALSAARRAGQYNDPNGHFSVMTEENQQIVIFEQVDLLSLLILIIYLYEDRVIVVWALHHQRRELTLRFRRVRQEVFKLGAILELKHLDTAARAADRPEYSIDNDFRSALKSTEFFEDADLKLRLAQDAELPAHSSLMCEYSLFFKTLLRGSNGFWIQGRREKDSAGKVPVDLTHMKPELYALIQQFFYAASGADAELFDQISSSDVDCFADRVLEVMDYANELMLERLIKIAQLVLGKLVNPRNICRLLNVTQGWRLVTQFETLGLEYIALQLEYMLENNLLAELDEPLLLQLDHQIRDNQQAHMPFSRTNNLFYLYEIDPHLVHDIKEERERWIREMAFKTQRAEERRHSLSSKPRCCGVDDHSASPIAGNSRRKSRASRSDHPVLSPSLRPQRQGERLVFHADEEVDGKPVAIPITPKVQQSLDVSPTSRLNTTGNEKVSLAVSDRDIPNFNLPGSLLHAPLSQGSSPSNPSPWGLSSTPPSKVGLGLREIMQIEASPDTSALTTGLMAERLKKVNPIKLPTKVSQKERKKLLQEQRERVVDSRVEPTYRTTALDDKQSLQPTPTKMSPWKVPPQTLKVNLADVLSTAPLETPNQVLQSKPLSVPSATPVKPSWGRVVSADTRFPGQARSVASFSGPSKPNASASSISWSAPRRVASASKVEPALSVGLADIINQQERELELRRAAVAKRSLASIQQEQEFEEWWDKQSRLIQATHAVEITPNETADKSKAGGGSAEGRNKGRTKKSSGGSGQRGVAETENTRGNGKVRDRSGGGLGGRGQDGDRTGSGTGSSRSNRRSGPKAGGNQPTPAAAKGKAKA